MRPDNYQSFEVYERCGDEWLTDGFGGPVAILTPAIESTMRIMMIPAKDRLRLLDKVKLISRVIKTEINKSRENNAET